MSTSNLLLLGGLLGSGRGGRFLGGSSLNGLGGLSSEGSLLGGGLFSVTLTRSLVAGTDSLSLVTRIEVG